MPTNEAINNTKEWKEANSIALRISAVKEHPGRDDRGKCWVNECSFFRLVQLRQDREKEKEKALIIQAQSM